MAAPTTLAEVIRSHPNEFCIPVISMKMLEILIQVPIVMKKKIQISVPIMHSRILLNLIQVVTEKGSFIKGHVLVAAMTSPTE
jgi:hypothetical protein